MFLLRETLDWAATQSLAQDDPSTPVHAVQLEDVLCGIKADCDELGHGQWLLSGSLTCAFAHV
jgi:hypothetical protein